jgi:death-on-curing protein
MAIRYIPEELVLTIHADLLQRYGGQPGLRDRGLLESALAQPRMTVGGKEVHKTLFEKTAAYGYHICNNHPFIDGNKRVAFVLMDVFLQKNGWEITAAEEDAYSMMMSLASGNLSKVQLASWLKEHSARLARR